MWGNSVAVRISAALIEAADLQVGDPVEVREEGGRLIIEPIRPAKVELDDLLAGITAENLHSAAGFGAPVGKEIW